MAANIGDGSKETNVRESVPDLYCQSFRIEDILARLIPIRLKIFKGKTLPIVHLVCYSKVRLHVSRV